jgi:hypothetical protein
MQAHERLINAHRAAQEGRHDFALREFVWFHNNALAENPALYGVRLSFALEVWHELGRSYPPALQELRRVRDARTALLFAGSGTRDMFDEVAAINRQLGEVNLTVALFEELHAKQPHLAVQCSSLVRSELVATGKFEIASQYLSDPEAHVRDICRALVEDVANINDQGESAALSRQAYIDISANEVGLACSILRGIGELDEAQRLELLAISLIDSAALREDFEARFGSNGPG